MSTALAVAILDADIDVARIQLARHGVRIQRFETTVEVWLPGLTDDTVILLDGANYDAHPVSLTVVDADHNPVPIERWPRALPHGTHPVTNEPFACLQGLREYFTHPSHRNESWDRYRNQLRLVHLIEHLLAKVPSP